MMLGVVGTQFFGKVDVVNDELYVATSFHHVFFLPLVYRGSFLFVGDAHCVRIPFCFKSVAFAYLRFVPSALIVLSCVLLLMLAGDDTEHGNAAWYAIASIAASACLLFLSYRYGRASEARARALQAYLAKLTSRDVEKVAPMTIKAGY